MSCDMSDYPCEMEHMAGNGTSRRHGSSRSIERQGSDLLGIYLKLLTKEFVPQQNQCKINLSEQFID